MSFEDRSSVDSPGGTADYDVIIVGGGPVGLLLGCLLKREGLGVRVLERRRESLSYSAAIGITPPSLGILRRVGLAEAFIEAGVRVQDCVVHGRSGRLGSVSFREIRDEHRFILSLPQAVTVGMLQGCLGTENVEMGCEVTGVRQVGEVCEVVTGDGRVLRARFVVGCDGSRSRVRECLCLRTLGGGGIGVRSSQGVRTYGCHFVMGDFVDRSGLGEEAHLFFTETGAVESFPLPGGMRRWIVQTEGPGVPAVPGLISGLIRERTGLEVAAGDQRSESAFSPHRYQSERYYAGRVILCGDAAHGMSPIGGQGMNTGFADAEFLAAVLGRGDEEALGLLPAYERYRRKASLAATRRAEWGMGLGTWRGRARCVVRDALIRHVLCRKWVSRCVAEFYAMLTIPYGRVPEDL
ncbi:FAD-dependent oxidoreductase [Prosthecobacter sp.]|uniref:FAD-dependent oxidoreductase n=1 Tax=Prosthecobacter sp. TaxID=1965333 RepID=UPI0037842FF9